MGDFAQSSYTINVNILFMLQDTKPARQHDLYMNVSLFLAKLAFVWVCFQILLWHITTKTKLEYPLGPTVSEIMWSIEWYRLVSSYTVDVNVLFMLQDTKPARQHDSDSGSHNIKQEWHDEVSQKIEIWRWSRPITALHSFINVIHHIKRGDFASKCFYFLVYFFFTLDPYSEGNLCNPQALFYHMTKSRKWMNYVWKKRT